MKTWLLSNLPWIWFIVGIICAAIEFVLPGLTTIWFGAGALVMVLLSFLPIPLAIQILIWLIISTILLIFTRPFAVKKLNANKEKTNVSALIGNIAIVTKTITKFEKGEIKVEGITWTAKTNDDTPLAAGSECKIVNIEGVTAIVTQVTE